MLVTQERADAIYAAATSEWAITLAVISPFVIFIVWALRFIWKTSTNGKCRKEALERSYGKSIGMAVWMLFSFSWLMGNFGNIRPSMLLAAFELVFMIASGTFWYWLTYREWYRTIGRKLLEILSESAMANTPSPRKNGVEAKLREMSAQLPETPTQTFDTEVADLSKPYWK